MASTGDALIEEPVPPYALDPFLFPTLIEEDAADTINPGSPAAIQGQLQRSLRCAESDGSHLFVGSSDGSVHSYQISESSHSSTTTRHRLVATRLISNKAKPVEKIVLLRAFQAAAIVCEGILSFYTVPEWTPIRSLPTTRAVSTVVLDDEEANQADGTDGAGMVSLCIVRRKNVVLVKIGAETPQTLRWAVIKEIPLSGGAIFARRFADTLCIANATEYSLMNLSSGDITSLHLPISQTGESPSAQVKPSIVSIPVFESARRHGSASPVESRSDSASNASQTMCEFLITSHTGTITLGVFVRPSGEPVAKLLEWPSHPRSVCFNGTHLISLLRNDTIEIHRITADEVHRVQVQQVPSSLESRFLQVVAKSNLSVAPIIKGKNETSRLDICKVRLEDLAAEPQVVKNFAVSSSASAPLQAEVVLCGRNSTSFVHQPELLDWALDHLDQGRVTFLHERMEEYEKHTTNSELASSFSIHAVYAALIIELLHRTRFADVTTMLNLAMFDPRVFIAMFPDLDGSRWLTKPQVNIAAVSLSCTAQRLRSLQTPTGGLKTIKDLIDDNFASNYPSPLDEELEATLRQLRQQLNVKAVAMLRQSINLWRSGSSTKKQTKQVPSSWPGLWMDDELVTKVDALVDTCYLNLLLSLREQRTDDLVDEDIEALLSSEHACDPAFVEAALSQQQYLALLSLHYTRIGEFEKSLELSTALLDGSMTDKFGGDIDKQISIDQVVAVLDMQEDSHLLSKYGTWLVRKDPEAGIRILTKKTAPTEQGSGEAVRGIATKAQELEAIKSHKATLRELQSIDSATATIYLETVALTTFKVQDELMHRDLARTLLSRVREHLQNKAYGDSMQNVAKDYSTGQYAESFFAHLALATGNDGKAVDRLKLAMLLQGSTVLDYAELLREVEVNEALVFERAIILGKLGRDHDALALLAVTLRDANSAEAYCSQDGEVLAPMLALSVAQDYPVLQPFASMLARTHAQRVKAHHKATGQHDLSDQERKEYLLKQLLSVYMENGAERSFRIATAHLLNTQALHLDGLEVLDLVPRDWPIQTLETFLTQNLRRQLHRKREANIVRNISLCRNLDVAEDLWARQRAMGGLLQDTEDEFVGARQDSDSDDNGDTSIIDHYEKKSRFRPPVEVHDVHIAKTESDTGNYRTPSTTYTR